MCCVCGAQNLRKEVSEQEEVVERVMQKIEPVREEVRKQARSVASFNRGY